jgi:predicted MFS family arabinose efflux permease
MLIALVTSAVPCVCIRMRSMPRKQRVAIHWNLLKEMKVDIWVVAWFFGNMGLYILFFFIQQYAADMSHLSQDAAFWSLIITNAASTSGRIIPGQVADNTVCHRFALMKRSMLIVVTSLMARRINELEHVLSSFQRRSNALSQVLEHGLNLVCDLNSECRSNRREVTSK